MVSAVSCRDTESAVSKHALSVEQRRCRPKPKAGLPKPRAARPASESRRSPASRHVRMFLDASSFGRSDCTNWVIFLAAWMYLHGKGQVTALSELLTFEMARVVDDAVSNPRVWDMSKPFS